MSDSPIPITTAEYRAQGTAQPKPAKRGRKPHTEMRRTGFKPKLRVEDLSVAVQRRLAEQGQIDGAQYGLNLPRRKPVRKVKDQAGMITHLIDTRGRRWPWPLPEHMSEADFDATLLDWGYKRGGMLKAWHCRNPQQSLDGWPDWIYLFRGRGVIVENKARDRQGECKGPSKAQKGFISCLLLAGYDVRQWTWPDDCWEAWETLTGQPAEDCPYWASTVAALAVERGETQAVRVEMTGGAA